MSLSILLLYVAPAFAGGFDLAGFSPLYRFDGTVDFQRIGTTMCGADLDGGGYDDIVFSSEEPVSGMSRAGGVYAYSGLDGHLFWRVQGTEADGYLGTTGLACTGDLSGDGIPDVLAHEEGSSHPAGAILVLSGKDGSLITVFTGEQAGDSF